MRVMVAGTHMNEMARRFAGGGTVAEVESLRRGHIHSSFVVTIDHREGSRRLLLQRINESVFADPSAVISNARSITSHLRDRLGRSGVGDVERRVLSPVVGDGSEDFVRDGEGGWWRAFRFIEGAAPAQRVDREHVEQAARAFGQFQRLLTDYDGPELAVTLPGFHDTPARLDALEAAAREGRTGRLAEVKAELEGILDRRALGSALSRDDLPIRLVHNDAKLDNVLFDTAAGEALCVVDLDTVMPGVVGHDFGDMVRSMSTRVPEDAAPGDLVEVDLSLYAAMTRGYLGVMGPYLSRVETQSLVPAGMVSTLEVAARFLTDHLQGDVYFRIDRPGQNLDRTRTQLALLESMIEARPRLEEIVAREVRSGF